MSEEWINSNYGNNDNYYTKKETITAYKNAQQKLNTNIEIKKPLSTEKLKQLQLKEMEEDLDKVHKETLKELEKLEKELKIEKLQKEITFWEFEDTAPSSKHPQKEPDELPNKAIKPK